MLHCHVFTVNRMDKPGTGSSESLLRVFAAAVGKGDARFS